MTNGNVGIGTWVPVNNLDLNGGMVIGSSYVGTKIAGSGNLAVTGSIGIGTLGSDSST